MTATVLDTKITEVENKILIILNTLIIIILRNFLAQYMTQNKIAIKLSKKQWC